MKSITAGLFFVMMWVGCADPVPNPGGESATDAAIRDAEGPDRGPADASSSDMTTRPPCPEPVRCQPRERQVGCDCLHVDNRECLTNEDCRPAEVCQSFENLKVCMFEPAPLRVCPGMECPGENDATLYAGASSRVITPRGFETPTPEGLDGVRVNFGDPFPEGGWNDCGLDGLCPGDPAYVAPDPGESDGLMQAIWLAGFGSGRPAQYCPMERVGCAAVDCCVSQLAHDDLKVQVTVVRKNGLTIAFGALDVVGYFHTDTEKIRRRVEAMGVDLLVMGATHNHEGPDTSGQWGPGPGFPIQTGRSDAYMQYIEDQTVAAINEAIETLEPAQMSSGVLDVGTEGLAVHDSRAPYIFNDDVPVVRFVSEEDGQPISTLLSFGNHAEVLWSGNTLITADYPHYVRSYIRDGLQAVTGEGGSIERPALEGTGGTVVFFAGTVGGLIYPGPGGALNYAGEAPEDDHSFEAADALGQRLASHVLGGLADGTIAPVDHETFDLSFANKRFLVPADNEVLRVASFAFDLIRRDIYNAANRNGNFMPDLPKLLSEVVLIRMGPVSFFTAPGEVFPETLCGGFPGQSRIRTPIVGDWSGRHTEAVCGEDGLPTEGGMQPCIIKADATNPPDWDASPTGPYGYEIIPGPHPFFIGLSMDFLGYMVPPYDFEGPQFSDAAPGDHYEETNSMGITIVRQWRTQLEALVNALGAAQ